MSKHNLKILLLEDEAGYRIPLVKRFEAKGHKVTAVATLPECEAAWKINGKDYNVIILDRRIEQEDGIYDSLDLLKIRREKKDKTPVLILTSRYLSDANRLEGLELLAEYVSKTCPFEELMLRTRNIYLNSLNARDAGIIETGRIRIDTLGQKVFLDGQLVKLGLKGYPFFLYLVRNEGHMVSHDILREKVWGVKHDPGTGIIQTALTRLKDKFKEIDSELELIKNVRGKGYIFQGNGFSD